MAKVPPADEDRYPDSTRSNDHASTDPNRQSLPRRRVLGAAATGLVTAIAGCTGGGGDGGGGGNGNSSDGGSQNGETSDGGSGEGSTTGIVESVEVLPGGREVRVTLSSTEEAEEIGIVQPDGGGLFRDEFSGTEFTVSIKHRHDPDVPHGEYKLYVGPDMDDQPYDTNAVGSATFTVTREVRITDVATKTVSDPGEYALTDLALVVTYENVGDLPVEPDDLELSGSITDSTKIVGQTTAPSVSPGETRTVEFVHNKRITDGMGREGYAFGPTDGDGEPDCSGSGEITVTLTRGVTVGGSEGPFAEATATVSLGGETTRPEYYGTYKTFACSEVTVGSVTPSNDGGG